MKKFFKKLLIKSTAILCSAMLLFMSPYAGYLDASSIQTVYASDWAIVGGGVAADAILKFLIGLLGSVAAKETYEKYEEEINQSFYDYFSAPSRWADLIGESVEDTCVKIYDKASNTIHEVSWEDVLEGFSSGHDAVVDDLTNLYAQYCPTLLRSFDDFVTDVLNGNVYIPGVSEMFIYDVFSDYESIQNSDGSYHFSGYEYFDTSANGNIYCNIFDCDSMYKLVGVYGASLNTILICRPDIYYGRTSLKATTVYGMRYINGELQGSISRNYLGAWAAADGTPSLKCLNIPLYSSSNDAITAIESGDFSSALNYSDITMESVIDLTHVPDLAPDIPPFTRSWQQREWERIANAPDVIGIGSYGHGVYDDNWGDDIPWIGLESLQKYSRSLLDIYNQIINDILNGTYDSTEDIPGTYSEAWEQAISDAWQDVLEHSTDSVPRESESDKSTEGEDTDTEEPSEGEAEVGEKEIIITNLGNEIDITRSKNHSTTTTNPSYKGEPNSSVDILDEEGNIITRRWFGDDGNATRDVDMTNHGNCNTHPEWPHEHFWEYGPDGTPIGR